MANIILVSSAGGTTLPSWPPKLEETDSNYAWLLFSAVSVALVAYAVVRIIKANRKGD